jgi:2-methylisocitrate lyase-like PEP mutase family enzyme
VPVTADFEAGFSDDPAGVEETVSAVIDAGAIGINLEDGLHDGKRALADPALHCGKIAAARRAGSAAGIPLFINARIDTFLLQGNSDDKVYAETLLPARAYADAGANGIFVPGLSHPKWIERLVQECSLPLNIMLTQATPGVRRLAELGEARISLGGMPFEFVRAKFRAAVSAFASTLKTEIFADAPVAAAASKA